MMIKQNRLLRKSEKQLLNIYIHYFKNKILRFSVTNLDNVEALNMNTVFMAIQNESDVCFLTC